MIDDLIYATGANPDYNPRMVESIVVQRLNGVRGDALHFSDGTSRMALLDAAGYVSYKVLWTDTRGNHHGRLWSYPRAFLERDCFEDFYPVAAASTQAGCVWIYYSATEEFAEIQTASGANPRITIEVLRGSVEDAGQEVLDRMILGLPLSWQMIPYSDPEEHPWEFWFGDDLEDSEPELFNACSDSGTLAVGLNTVDEL